MLKNIFDYKIVKTFGNKKIITSRGLKCKISYDDINQDEETRIWYKKTSKKILGIEHYKNDVKHGKFEYYYRNGKLSLRCYYSYGKLDGCYQTWYLSGIPNKEINYKNGLLHGETKMWYASGNQYVKKIYNDDILKHISSWKDSGEIIKILDF
ncbi:MAG: hypothetical protein RR144_04605 [Clostridia bacterium]